MPRGVPDNEILTSDIGLALYLLANGHSIGGIEYEIGKRHKSARFKMKICGPNPEKFCNAYRSQFEVHIEFKKYLPILFEQLSKIKPDIVDVTYSNIRAYKSPKGYGYGE